MRDELDRVADANPVQAETLRPAVAVEHRILLDTLRAEVSPSRRRLFVPSGRSTASNGRAGFVGVGVGVTVAAAIAVIGFTGIGNVPDVEVSTDVSGADHADTQSAEDTLVVEEPVTTPTSTDPAPGATEPASPPAEAESSVTSSPPEITAPSTSSSTTQASTTPTIEGPFDPRIDLLSVHYDHAPGRDDAQSAVAAREITDRLGIEPHVVSGTYGTNGHGYNTNSEYVMDEAWGDAWYNAHSDRQGAVLSTADRWLATIDAGGRVWVAEGGQSDFTAGVIRELQQRRPGLDTRQVLHVVQHNDFNEEASTDADLDLVRSATTYTRIADGNIADNGTADLDMMTPGFADIALGGRYGSAWQAAFDYHHQDGRIDFSDTVEVLHIIGVGTDEVADPLGFADYFLR